MLIIGHRPETLEAIRDDPTVGPHRTTLVAEARRSAAVPEGLASWGCEHVLQSRGDRQPLASGTRGMHVRSRAAPAASPPASSPLVPATMQILDVWRQIPQEIGPLLAARLLLMARRIQEHRRSNPLHDGGPK